MILYKSNFFEIQHSTRVLYVGWLWAENGKLMTDKSIYICRVHSLKRFWVIGILKN